MKKKIMVLLVIIATIIGIIFSIKIDAGTSKLYTRLTALNLDGIGYGIGDPTNKGKYIWHMSTFDSIKGGISATQKNIYCLRAEYGASWEEFQFASDILEYNMKFDFQKDRENLSNKIITYPGDDRDEIVKNILDENGTQYREILWLLDNMYIVGQTNKEDYLGRVGIKKDVYEGVTEYYNEITGQTYGEEVVTDADIIAIQRAAVWTITNGNDYDKTENSHWLRTTTNGQDYTLLSESRDLMATDLYKHLVKSARTGAKLYTPENNFSIKGTTVGVNLDGITQKNDKYIAQISGSNYIIGPIVLNKNNDLFYEISMKILDENKTLIEKEKYHIIDLKGNDVELKDMVGKSEGFYIKVPTSLAKKVNVQIQVTQYNTTKNLWLVGSETETTVELDGEQPVAEFSREPQTTTVEFIAQEEIEEVETKDIEITKKWEDENNRDGIRPKSVTVILYANGVEIDRKEVTGEGNDWKVTFTKLPIKEQGKDIIYTIDEEIVPGYEKIINGFEITNKHEITKKFDLALRKYITQINEKDLEETRIPNIDKKPLEKETTAIYKHRKDPVKVKENDIVTYKITIYNEGEKAGYASQIIDQLPEGLILETATVEANKNKYIVKYEKQTNRIILDIVNTKENPAKALQPYKDEEIDNETIEIKCKVVHKAKTDASNILTNVAWINEAFDIEGNKQITKVGDDRDSEPGTKPDVNKNNMENYKGNEENPSDLSNSEYFYKGEQDDDDFEKLKVEFFDLSILKFVSKVIINENGENKITETGYNGHEDPEPVVKVELHKKKIENVIVKFVYGITVTNEGMVPGYAKEITDYIPQGLKFESNDNPEWMDEGNNVISTKQLEDVLLQPGESKTIEVVLTWINGKDNMALKTNTVEISEDQNTNNIPDRDSTPDNKKEGEDDIDIAKVILVISTGKAKTYFTLALGLLFVIATGIIIIKKFVI